MKIITPDQFDPYAMITLRGLQPRKRGHQKKHDKRSYKDIITAFDIETTSAFPEIQSFMYIWMWAFNDTVVIGRTWEEFLQLQERICAALNEGEYIVVYVHNLAFEFQFLKGIYPFENDEVFAVESRRVLKCDMHKHFEFRCSYRHSNMSLDEFTRTMKVEHQKLAGELDYSIERYPWTEMTGTDLAYCINDVLGLVEAIQTEMLNDDDNLYTIPLTSTGYVRRDAKKALASFKYRLPYLLPNYEQYTILREAFRGGNTHANRFYAGQILEDVSSADRSSSYPDVMCNCPFPMGEWQKMPDSMTLAEIINLVKNRHKAFFFRLCLWDVKLIDPYFPCPYLSRDKCRNVQGGRYDNGRILEAQYLETSITDVDLLIILSEYEFSSSRPFSIYCTYYGMLPDEFTDCIKEYYRLKTALKGDKSKEYLYNKSKAKLNSLYGMSAQDPVKLNILYNGGEWTTETDCAPQEVLEEHNKQAFIPYTWGVWVTSWARMRLEEGIRLAGHNFVYADTDSVKYLGDIDWTAYNEERIHDSIISGAYADDAKGIRHYMGVFEFEEKMLRFSTLGAKKYCYVEEDNSLHVTIAGVNKREGAKELQRIENFKSGFIFSAAGGTEAIYNDAPEIAHLIREGRRIPITSNVVLKPSTYTLGITGEYERLLANPQYFLDEYMPKLFAEYSAELVH